jgi:hypothetical protein
MYNFGMFRALCNPRRWFRFSLRTLFVVTTVLGACLGWWAKVASQRDAVARIRSLERSTRDTSVSFHYSYDTLEPAAPFWTPDIDWNAASWAPQRLLQALGKDFFHSIRYVRVHRADGHQRQEIAEQIARLSNLRHLEFAAGATDEMVKHFVKLRKLRTLRLYGDSLTDDSLLLIGGLTSLESLSIGGSFPDTGFLHLRNLKSLKCLTVTSPNITARGVAAIARLPNLQTLRITAASPHGLSELEACESLTFLSLCRANLTDDDLKQIAGLTSLERLDLSGNSLSGRGLRHLSALRNLRELDLSGCGITDGGIKNLSSLVNLEKLDVRHSLRMTDAGLAPLIQLTNLRELNLDCTGVSINGALQLKELRRLRRLIVPRPSPCGTGLLERELLGLSPYGLSDNQMQLLQRLFPKCTVTFAR